MPRGKIEILDDEYARVGGIDRRDERLVADRGELAVAELHAKGSCPPTDLRLQQLEPELRRIVREARADLLALELDVLVVVDAHAHVDAFDGAPELAPTTAQIHPPLVEIDAHLPLCCSALFFMAMAQEQDGQTQEAIASFKALIADAPADAPWIGAVRARLERLQGRPDAAATIAGLPAGEREAAIRGMVAGLAARLAEGGGSLPEWSRLIRSQAVLGERTAAAKSLATARERLAADPAALGALDALRAELGLQETAP